ncbi:MAG: TIM-barrel domain-containing protein [Sphaerochaetaceae bacterium]
MENLVRSGNFVFYKNIRISVLTDRLVRVEYDKNNQFEDRNTQKVVNRDFPLVEYSAEVINGYIEINTKGFYLESDGNKPTPNGLMISIKGYPFPFVKDWHYGEKIETFGGTVRTLDGCDGSCELEDGIFSKAGYSVIDDSDSMIINDNDIFPRKKGGVDFYYFGYGLDYLGGLKDFYFLCGNTPLIPRYALGNWWSRFYKYSQEEYLDLMDQFKEEAIPFSVSVIDMDWHLVEIDKQYGSGWTGYTFNSELFPTPKLFFNELHKRGLVTALNDHPADGVRAFENGYKEFAKEMGIDFENEKAIRFDVTSKKYLEGLQKYILTPLEKLGVDFWWIDWQQGTNTRIEGLDPLWILNQTRFKASEKDGKRPIIFSRYAGIGSHRYPIGFSGDTVSSWKSLDFQPYFTSTASNVGYTWWSHDIGGHMLGSRDDELSLRWLQFGVFSPIMRLHSTVNEFMGKEPWNYPLEVCTVMKDFLRLRHKLIPYLYTMNYRTSIEGEPLIQPMYYKNPGNIPSYFVNNEYYFGSSMIVLPITEKEDSEIKMAKVKAWLPSGDFYDFFNDLHYTGDRSIEMHRSFSSIPVLVKAGSIIPMTDETNASNNPKSLTLKIYGGKSGSFTLYEDDGLNKSVFTEFIFDFDKGKFTILPVSKNEEVLPITRNYKLKFVGIENLDEILLKNVETKIGKTLELGKLKVKKNDYQRRIKKIVNFAQIDFGKKDSISNILNKETDKTRIISQLIATQISVNLLSSICEILLAE